MLTGMSPGFHMLQRSHPLPNPMPVRPGPLLVQERRLGVVPLVRGYELVWNRRPVTDPTPERSEYREGLQVGPDVRVPDGNRGGAVVPCVGACGVCGVTVPCGPIGCGVTVDVHALPYPNR